MAEQDGRHGEQAATPTPSAPTPPSAPSARSRDLGSNLIAGVIGNLFPPLALLVTAPVLAHTLGVTGRGQVAAATAPLLLVTAAATFGLPQATTFAIARAPRVLRRAVRSATELIVLAGLVATVAVLLSAHWLGGRDRAVPQLIVVAALAIVPSLLLTILRGAASGLHRWRLVATEQLISAVVELGVLVALAAAGHLTPLTATVVIAFTPLLGAAAYLPVVRGMPAHDETEPVLGTRRQMVNYGSLIWVGSLSGVVLSLLDQTLMTPLASAYQLGLYATAVTVSRIPLIINSAVRDVTFAADASENLDRRLERAARVSSAMAAVAGLATGLTMWWWLPLLFGEQFRPAIPSAAVLLVSAVLGTPGSIAGAGLGARGRPGLRSVSLLVAAVVNATLVVVLVGPFGAMGAAVATLVGSLIASNGCVLFLWRYFGVDPRHLYGLRRDDLQAVVRYLQRRFRAARPAPGGTR